LWCAGRWPLYRASMPRKPIAPAMPAPMTAVGKDAPPVEVEEAPAVPVPVPAADEAPPLRVVGLRVAEWTLEMMVEFPDGEMVAVLAVPEGTKATEVETIVTTEADDDGAGVLNGVLDGVTAA